jgi:hypothetical protein
MAQFSAQGHNKHSDVATYFIEFHQFISSEAFLLNNTKVITVSPKMLPSQQLTKNCNDDQKSTSNIT